MFSRIADWFRHLFAHRHRKGKHTASIFMDDRIWYAVYECRGCGREFYTRQGKVYEINADQWEPATAEAYKELGKS